MKKISIEELRKSLVEQIKEKLNGITDGFYYLGDDGVNVVLSTGQMMPCMCVKMKDETPLFGISLVGIRDFDLGCNDLTVDSLDAINRAIKLKKHTMDIWAANDGDYILLYLHDIAALPDCENEAISYLNEIMLPGCSSGSWERLDRLSWTFAFWPDPCNKDRYLVAHFE